MKNRKKNVNLLCLFTAPNTKSLRMMNTAYIVNTKEHNLITIIFGLSGKRVGWILGSPSSTLCAALCWKGKENEPLHGYC